MEWGGLTRGWSFLESAASRSPYAFDGQVSIAVDSPLPAPGSGEGQDQALPALFIVVSPSPGEPVCSMGRDRVA